MEDEADIKTFRDHLDADTIIVICDIVPQVGAVVIEIHLGIHSLSAIDCDAACITRSSIIHCLPNTRALHSGGRVGERGRLEERSAVRTLKGPTFYIIPTDCTGRTATAHLLFPLINVQSAVFVAKAIIFHFAV